MLVLAGIAALLCPPDAASAALIDLASTPEDSGIIGGVDWAPSPGADGFRIDWEIYSNGDGTWHYIYTFRDEDESALTPATSHVIIQLSDNIEADDLFNFSGDADPNEVEFGTFGEHQGNPGFPTGKSIFGVKIALDGDQSQIEFDATRQPMWGDFYAKGGSDSYAYNADIGVAVANLYEYDGTPVDGEGQPLGKILVPDTVPEPASLAMLALGGLALARTKRRNGRRLAH